jgi:hypothetical protein
MREILDGVLHWTAVHPNIETEVSSYYVAPARTLVDPMASEAALEWFADRDERPDRIILTNRHHLRGSERFHREFGCTIHCHRAGLHEFRGGPLDVEGFAFGDEPAPRIRALEVGAICEEETALLIERGSGALAVADAVVNYGGLRFVPDHLLGDNPDVVKERIRGAYGRLLDRRFDALLFAHGPPITDGGKELLQEFVGQ